MTTTAPRDMLGVEIKTGDWVRVTAWGSPVRLSDVSHMACVTGFTASGNVRLARSPHDTDPIANGRAVSPRMLGVLRRDEDAGIGAGYEGNRHLYTRNV